MLYDLVVRDGTVVDGTGFARYRGDIGIRGALIVHIGRIPKGNATKEIAADGLVVAPGFIDSHTHMDAQVFWNPQGTNSAWHGVTTAIMGNCGFTLAPNRRGNESLVIRSLEKSEDIPVDVIQAGIPEFNWETFGEYLTAVEALPKALNYAAYVGHSAIRTWSMGERAFHEAASAGDLEKMKQGLREALDSGAIGLSTSRSPEHQTIDGEPVASRLASWDEFTELVGVLNDYPASNIQFTREGMTTTNMGLRSEDLVGRLTELVRASGATVHFTQATMQPGGEDLYEGLALLDSLNRVGHYVAHTPVRGVSSILSFRTRMPFDSVPDWADIRGEALDRQRKALEDPARRRKLVHAALHGPYRKTISAEGGYIAPDYRQLRVVKRADGRNPSVADLCGDQDPVDYIIDLALESNFEQLFERLISNEEHDPIFDALRHPGVIIGASDAGAHVKQICFSDLHTYLLAHWVRDTGAFSLETGVRMCTSDIAQAWNLNDRGTIALGKAADLVVFDPDEIAPLVPRVEDDLPAGGSRLTQRSKGIHAIVVNGELTIMDGVPTGAMPGTVLRRKYRL